jgi:hypothetical protein
MAELVASLAMEVVHRIVEQTEKLAATDEAAKRIMVLVRNMGFTIEEAMERGVFRSLSLENTKRNLDIVLAKLRELESWITEYNNAGKKKGRLARLRDYFYAGKNLEQLKSLSQELDGAFRRMDLSLSLEVCAGVKDLVEHQSDIAQDVFQLIQQHSGNPDDRNLAQTIANKTKIAMDEVKQELSSNMGYLRRMDDNVQFMKLQLGDLVEAVQRIQEGMNERLNSAQREDMATCLELAPFSVTEWVNERLGMCTHVKFTSVYTYMYVRYLFEKRLTP